MTSGVRTNDHREYAEEQDAVAINQIWTDQGFPRRMVKSLQ
jgi:hypothetical protein